MALLNQHESRFENRISDRCACPQPPKLNVPVTELCQRSDLLRPIAEHVLLSSCALKTSGLYEGRAGCALSLFAYGAACENEQVSEQAYRLCQESLICATEDLSLESGWMGIGFMLLQLLEHGLLEADYEEVIGEHHQLIMARVEQSQDDQSSWSVIHYLLACYRLLGGEVVQQQASAIAGRLEQRLAEAHGQVLSETSRCLNAPMLPVELLQRTEDYIQISLDYPGLLNSNAIMNLCHELHQKGLLQRSCILVLAEVLTGLESDESLDAFIRILSPRLPLRAWCDLAVSLHRYKPLLLPALSAPADIGELTRWLWQRMPANQASSYALGLPRFLLTMLRLRGATSIQLA